MKRIVNQSRREIQSYKDELPLYYGQITSRMLEVKFAFCINVF
jgi:hypothetical protein